MMLLLLLLVVAAAQEPSAGVHTLCGRELAKARSMYCNMNSVPEEPLDTTLPKFDANRIGGTKIPPRFTHKLRRAAGQAENDFNLIEKCCLKPCHISELLKTC